MGTEDIISFTTQDEAYMAIAQVIQDQVGYETAIQWRIAKELVIRERMAQATAAERGKAEWVSSAAKWILRLQKHWIRDIETAAPIMTKARVLQMINTLPGEEQLEAAEKEAALKARIGVAPHKWYETTFMTAYQDNGLRALEVAAFTIVTTLGILFLASLIVELITIVAL